MTSLRLQINSSVKVYDLYAYVTNENNEIVYQVTSIPEVDLNYMKVASSSDGYISGALLYLNTYANNTITRYSDTLFSSTNDVGEIQEINYYSGPDYENVNYLISVEGGVDIATNVTNVFIMYKPLTNASEFKVTYLTTLQTYYIVLSGLSTFEAESKVLSLFKLDGYANIDINTYDPILDLIKETNGSADAYKENTYLSILISELINAGKTQTEIMNSIINHEISISPSTFSDTTYVSAVINDMNLDNDGLSSANFTTNINSLFSQIAGFDTVGSTLATDITKAKAAAFALSLFEAVLDESAIEAGITTAAVGVLEQPTISDASDVSVETSDSINIVNVISYDSTATPIGANLILPVYYDDYSTPFTVVDNGSDTLTIFYDDSTDAIKNRLSLLENTFAIEDIIGVDLIINSSITISTDFTLTINQANQDRH